MPTKKELEEENAELKRQIETMKHRLEDLGDNGPHCFVEGCGLPAKYEGWHIPGGGMMYRRTVCEGHKHVLGPKN